MHVSTYIEGHVQEFETRKRLNLWIFVSSLRRKNTWAASEPRQYECRQNTRSMLSMGPQLRVVIRSRYRTKRNLRRFDNFNVGHFDLFSLGLGFFTGWRSPKTDGWCQICIQTVGSILRIKVPNTFTMISNVIELVLRDHRNKDQLHPLKRSCQQQQQAQKTWEAQKSLNRSRTRRLTPILSASKNK